MKKFLRGLLSGYFLIILMLLIEIALLIIINFYFDDLIALILQSLDISVEDKVIVAIAVMLGYALVKGIAFIIGLIIFFKIVNRQEDPEFKIPWIVGMLLLPFFFSVLFLIFGRHSLCKKDRVIVSATKNAYNAHFLLKEDELAKQKKELGDAAGAFQYLHNITSLGATKNNRVTYFKTGEQFFPDLIESLKKAKEFIFIEFFIITDGKEWSAVTDVLKQKAQEGVDVRIVYDDMGCSGTISYFTPRRLKKYGIKCYKFHPFRPILSGVYNNRDHRKIVVIDHQFGYTGGCNLADEYANVIKRFGYWKDTMVKIEGRAINNLIATFLQNYDLCTGFVSDFNKFLLFDYPKYNDDGYVMPFGDGPGGIDDALVGEQNYINMLHYAKKSVYISTPYLVPTYQLLDAMRNAAYRGVDIHLILPGIPDKKAVYAVAKSYFRWLMDAGVKIHIYKPGFNHMKTMIVDDELAFVGTINYDFRSLVHHFECGTLLYKTKCCKEIREDFDEMISVSTLVPQNFKLKLGTRWFCSLVKIITPLL